MSERISLPEVISMSSNDTNLDTQSDLFNCYADIDALSNGRERVCLLVTELTGGRSRDRIADEMTGLPT